MIKEDNASLASSSFKSIPDSSITSATLTSLNGASQTTHGQDSTIYNSLLSNTINNSDTSFDVLDSSRAESLNLSERIYNSVGSNKLMSPERKSAIENNKSSVESASRNLFGSGQVQRKRSLTNEKAPPRNRQDSTCSTGSDIVVLKRQISQGESDITLLSNPSQSSIAVIEQESIFPGQPENNLMDKNVNPVTFTMAGEALKGNTSVGSGQLQTVMESSTCDADLSPMGSLTNKTLNSMVSSMYEKSLAPDNVSTSSQDSSNKEKSLGLHRVSSNDSFLSATGGSDFGSEKVAINKPLKNLNIYQDSSPSVYR